MLLLAESLFLHQLIDNANLSFSSVLYQLRAGCHIALNAATKGYIVCNMVVLLLLNVDDKSQYNVILAGNQELKQRIISLYTVTKLNLPADFNPAVKFKSIGTGGCRSDILLSGAVLSPEAGAVLLLFPPKWTFSCVSKSDSSLKVSNVLLRFRCNWSPASVSGPDVSPALAR